jgi:hypothetical protein
MDVGSISVLILDKATNSSRAFAMEPRKEDVILVKSRLVERTFSYILLHCLENDVLISPVQSSAKREEISAASFSRLGVNANVDDWMLDENDEDLVFPLPE